MTRLFKLLFPHASTSADLAQVEKELQDQLNALRSRLDVAAAQAGVVHETNEIILGSLRGRVTALEAGLATAIRRLNAQANLIDALEAEVSRPLDPEIEARLNAVREAIKGAQTTAMERARDLVRSGKITPNQARAYIDLAPMPGGDAKIVGLDTSEKSEVSSLIVSDGEAKPTEVIRLKPTKGPKGGSRK